MKIIQKGRTEAAGMIDKRRDKERRREEKEMAKMALAAGISMDMTSHTASSSDKAMEPLSEPVLEKLNLASTTGGGWKKVSLDVNTAVNRGSTVAKSQDSPNLMPTTSKWKVVKPISQRSGDLTPSSVDTDYRPRQQFRSSGHSILETSGRET